MGSLILVRHGETDWNRSGRIMGRQPIPLNSDGQAQAKHLASVVKKQFPVQGIYSSPMLRCMQTAEFLAEELGLPVYEETGLSEIHVGKWEGLYWKDLETDPIKAKFYTEPTKARLPGGETLYDIQQRAIQALQDSLFPQLDNRDNCNFLIVSHADVLRTILGHFLSIPLHLLKGFPMNHAALSVLELTSSGSLLKCLNCYHNVTP